MNQLDFKLTTRFNPENLGRKFRKSWISACGKYRITWRRQFMSIAMIPRYFALKLAKRHLDGKVFWDFADEHRPYKTFKKAYQACCKVAGIILEEEVKSKRRRKRKQIVFNEPPAVVAQDLLPKKRGRPKGSKNHVKTNSG